MRGVLALSYLKVSLYIRVISRNVEILSLALIIPRLILKDPLNGSMYVIKEISDQKWGDIVALVRFGCLLNKSLVKEIVVKSIRLWVDICGMSYSDIKSSTSDPIYNTFLFSGYMSLAGDNPDLKKFIVSLRSRMLRYDLTCLCLYLAMSMAINGGIILSEQDLLDALIL